MTRPSVWVQLVTSLVALAYHLCFSMENTPPIFIKGKNFKLSSFLPSFLPCVLKSRELVERMHTIMSAELMYHTQVLGAYVTDGLPC